MSAGPTLAIAGFCGLMILWFIIGGILRILSAGREQARREDEEFERIAREAELRREDPLPFLREALVADLDGYREARRR